MKQKPKRTSSNQVFHDRGKIKPPLPLRINLTSKEIDKMIEEIRADHIDMKQKK